MAFGHSDGAALTAGIFLRPVQAAVIQAFSHLGAYRMTPVAAPIFVPFATRMEFAFHPNSFASTRQPPPAYIQT